MYQNLDHVPAGKGYSLEDDDGVIIESNARGSSWSKIVKVVTGCTALIALFAVSSQTRSNFTQSTGVNSIISQLTELDQLPKETVFSEVTEENKQYIFSLYAKKFSRTYANEEYSSRLATFKSNLELIDDNNSNERKSGGLARHGITKYTDMSVDEIKSTLLSGRKPGLVTSRSRGEAKFVEIPEANGSATIRDWTGVMTTPVIDQGYCGSCWAWSTVFQLESDAIRSKLLTPKDTLSVQQLLSCDEYDLGCNGGWTELGFAYAMENPIMLSTSYPYASFDVQDGVAPQCKLDEIQSPEAKTTDSTFGIQVVDFYGISTEQEMIDYVLNTGPLSVCAASSDWVTYVEGVLTTCSGDVDHCVQIVGVDTEQGFWKVRNTWGEDWGEDGYIRLAVGENLCGIVTDAMYADVTSVNLST